MEYTAEKVGEVRDLGDIYRVDAPLDKQLKAFAKLGISDLASADEIAQIRLAGIQEAYSRTSIAPIAMKDKKTILFRESPLMNILTAGLAVKAHRKGEYFTMPAEIYEFAEQIANEDSGIEPENRRAIFTSKNEDYSLTQEMDETRFLLRNHNIPYFDKFVKNGKKGKIPFCNLKSDIKDEAIVNYLWFVSPDCGSDFGCVSRSLDYSCRAFGVLHAAEGSARKKG